MPPRVTWRSERTTSSSSTNCSRGSNPKMAGQSGRDRFRLMAVVRWGPRTLANRSTVTSVPGLSSEKSRTRLSASSSARSMLCVAGPLRGVSS